MTEQERSDAIQSALAGLTVSEAREFLYRFMDERLDNMIVASPDASPVDAALMRMAAQVGRSPQLVKG